MSNSPDVITFVDSQPEDYSSSLDYWTKYGTFGIDEDYQEQIDYVKAQDFWKPIKVEFLTAYKDKPEVLRFINNLTLMCFYENDSNTYCISLILKDGLPQRPCYSHCFIDLIFNPTARIKNKIKITEYDLFQYDVYEELMDQHYDDATFDDARIDRELLLAFLKTTGWEKVLPEEVSPIFTRLFEYYRF